MKFTDMLLGLGLSAYACLSASFHFTESIGERVMQSGVNLTCFQDRAFDEDAKKSIDKIANQGYDYVIINPIFYQESTDSDTIRQTAFNRQHIESLIDYSKSKGMKVMMKPLIDISIDKSRKDAFPNDINKWFDNYSSIITDLANLCEQKTVEKFAIATELDSMLLAYPEKFGKLAKDVKGIYSGLTVLAFVFNYDDDTVKVNVVEKLPVDYVGIDFYVHMKRDSDGFLEPLHYMENIEKASLKPVWITEVGYRSVKVKGNKPSFNYNIKGKRDDVLQYDNYENFLNALLSKKWDRIKGFGIWVTDGPMYSKDILGDLHLKKAQTGYTIFGKSAEKLLTDYNRIKLLEQAE